MTTNPDLPLVMTQAGPQPTAPATIQNNLINQVIATTTPGYTARLPGILIEDVSSTEVMGISQIDQLRVDLINSLTPYGANAFLLNQMAQVSGCYQQDQTNTSVNLIFTGPAGFVIAPGFTVTDGAYQYQTIDGGVISSSGVSEPITFFGTQSGSWAVVAGTVTEFVTSVPSNINLTCTNPFPGTPGIAAQTESDFRSRVLLSWRAAGQGMPSYIKTLVTNVPGVQPRLVSVRQIVDPAGWQVLVGGGDNLAVAYAIYRATMDISSLVGSELVVVGITTGANAVVTTNLNHGYSNGQVVYLSGVLGTMQSINGVPLTVTVINETSFSTGVSTSTFGTYTAGGTLTPNFRNNLIALTDYPDVYQVAFVSPPQQLVTAVVTWNTSSPGYVNSNAVAQLGAPAVAAYINSIVVGQPINTHELNDAFSNAISPILSPVLLTRLVVAISINGYGATPETGSLIVPGDPESYFYADPTGAGIVVVQG